MKKLQFDFNGNMAGVSRIFAIPVTSYRRVRRDLTTKKNFLEVINLDDIIDIYIIDDSASFSQESDKGVYDVNISGITPKSMPINHDTLIKLDTEDWFVLCQDNNDQVRLGGNDENRLRFRRNDTTGVITDRNQISFTFYGLQSTPCEFIELNEMDNL